MNDASAEWNWSGEPSITLVAVNTSYWMYRGEEFLNQMLSGQGFYPRPVRCLVFEDAFSLSAFLGKGPSIVDYWGINPDVVDRLRRDEDLLELRYPDDVPDLDAKGL